MQTVSITASQLKDLFFYIAPEKATFNPTDYYKKEDAYVSEAFDTYEQARAVLDTMPHRRFLRVVEVTEAIIE